MPNIKEKSLRDMDFEEVSIKYENLFAEVIGKELFKKINEEYRNKYQIFIRYKNDAYNSPSSMNRNESDYGRNVIYGWFVEDLIIKVLEKNSLIKSVHLFGKDKNHDFIYNHEIKKILIDGEKSTDPDIEMTLKNGNKFLLELKTGNKDVFTVKEGNVNSLFKSVANYEQYCLIMMLDLAKGLYEIKDLTYFETQKSFSNKRMEGQICYNFPAPNTGIETLTKINFDSFANMLVLENIWVKKFKLLKIAIEKGNKIWKKIIENKIKLEKLEEEMNINIDDFKYKIKKIKVKIPEVEMSWEKIENEVKKI
ncbi:hypothetical protein HGA92_05405 [Candidatus Gracilibacteria bacterium]|nr:hypothetical protein [Candidatus Gracilibacteria bacterium]NUJ99068.1 hypothetical protein [Candidatus Gracilibacteria bacterium]